MQELQIRATARVKITKRDEAGNIIGVEEQVVQLTDEEAKNLWHSQQQV